VHLANCTYASYCLRPYITVVHVCYVPGKIPGYQLKLDFSLRRFWLVISFCLLRWCYSIVNSVNNTQLPLTKQTKGNDQPELPQAKRPSASNQLKLVSCSEHNKCQVLSWTTVIYGRRQYDADVQFAKCTKSIVLSSISLYTTLLM